METQAPKLTLEERIKIYNEKPKRYVKYMREGKLYEYAGYKKPLSEWASIYEINVTTLYGRIKRRGYSIKEALNAKVIKQGENISRIDKNIDELISVRKVELANYNAELQRMQSEQKKAKEMDIYALAKAEKEELNMDAVNDFFNLPYIWDPSDFQLQDADAATWHLKRVFNRMYSGKQINPKY